MIDPPNSLKFSSWSMANSMIWSLRMLKSQVVELVIILLFLNLGFENSKENPAVTTNASYNTGSNEIDYPYSRSWQTSDPIN